MAVVNANLFMAPPSRGRLAERIPPLPLLSGLGSSRHYGDGPRGARVPSAGVEKLAGPVDVLADLAGQLLRRGEGDLVAEPVPELDRDRLPLDVPVEFQEERLHSQGLAAEGGIRPHVDGGEEGPVLQ